MAHSIVQHCVALKYRYGSPEAIKATETSGSKSKSYISISHVDNMFEQVSGEVVEARHVAIDFPDIGVLTRRHLEPVLLDDAEGGILKPWIRMNQRYRIVTIWTLISSDEHSKSR